MDFKEYMNLVYIRGYFDKKEQFARKLIKGSVQEPDKISVSDALIKSYLRGDSLHSLSQMMWENGLQAEMISAFIEGLFNLKHKMTETYKRRYHGQTYKEALYDKVKEKHPDVTMDEMADFLSKQFIEIIKSDYDALISQAQSQPQSTIKCGTEILGKLREIVLQMNCLFSRLGHDSKCIADWLKRQSLSTQYSACPQWKTFHDAFQELQNKNAELKAISEVVQCDELSDAVAMGGAFHAQSLALCYHEKYPNHQLIREQFECYRKKLIAINAELERRLK